MTSIDKPKQTRPDLGDRPLPCEEIQALMLDYMQHDLGEGRSDLVREHIRRCPVCHERMKEIQETIGILHDAPFPHGRMPEHLSERHYNRLARAIMHPILDWVYVHHILISALVAIMVIATVFFGLRRYKVWKESLETGIPVVIGQEESPE